MVNRDCERVYFGTEKLLGLSPLFSRSFGTGVLQEILHQIPDAADVRFHFVYALVQVRNVAVHFRMPHIALTEVIESLRRFLPVVVNDLLKPFQTALHGGENEFRDTGGYRHGATDNPCYGAPILQVHLANDAFDHDVSHPAPERLARIVWTEYLAVL